MTPPDTVSGAAAKQPPRKRKTMSEPMLGAASRDEESVSMQRDV